MERKRQRNKDTEVDTQKRKHTDREINTDTERKT